MVLREDRSCADLFHHRRHALDDALDELAERYREDGHTWRSRKDLESYIRYLLAARTAYFAPTDWATPQGDLLRRAGATETQVLVESWHYLARRPDKPGTCPVLLGERTAAGWSSAVSDEGAAVIVAALRKRMADEKSELVGH